MNDSSYMVNNSVLRDSDRNLCKCTRLFSIQTSANSVVTVVASAIMFETSVIRTSRLLLNVQCEHIICRPTYDKLT